MNIWQKIKNLIVQEYRKKENLRFNKMFHHFTKILLLVFGKYFKKNERHYRIESILQILAEDAHNLVIQTHGVKNGPS